jgi:hypothetical protein
VYGALVVYGFVVWLRATAAERQPARQEVTAA